MIGLVLAAGAGRRLRPLTDELPKTLLPVHDDTTILDIALANLASVDLREVVVVVGYAASAVEERKSALEKRHGVRIHLVDNDKAEEWNNAYSLWLAREYFDRGVLLLNGDTVHPVSVERTLLAGRGPEVLLAVDDVKTLTEEAMKVVFDDDGQLERIHKSLDSESAHGEYIGATIIEPTAAGALTDALRSTWQRDPNLYYEDAFQEFVGHGGVIRGARIGTVDWIEVDDHQDLAKARTIACRY